MQAQMDLRIKMAKITTIRELPEESQKCSSTLRGFLRKSVSWYQDPALKKEASPFLWTE